MKTKNNNTIWILALSVCIISSCGNYQKDRNMNDESSSTSDSNYNRNETRQDKTSADSSKFIRPDTAMDRKNR
jgi:hypothetical protein